MSRLFEQYKHEIIPQLMTKFAYKNVMQVPRLEKSYSISESGKPYRIPKRLMVRSMI